MEPNVAYQINDVCFMISFPSLIGSLIYINIYIKGKALSKLSSLKFRIIFLMTGNRLLSVAEIKQ